MLVVRTRIWESRRSASCHVRQRSLDLVAEPGVLHYTKLFLNFSTLAVIGIFLCVRTGVTLVEVWACWRWVVSQLSAPGVFSWAVFAALSWRWRGDGLSNSRHHTSLTVGDRYCYISQLLEGRWLLPMPGGLYLNGHWCRRWGGACPTAEQWRWGLPVRNPVRRKKCAVLCVSQIFAKSVFSLYT